MAKYHPFSERRLNLAVHRLNRSYGRGGSSPDIVDILRYQTTVRDPELRHAFTPEVVDEIYDRI